MKEMKSLEESVVTAMDGTSTEIFPFLPYILQDFWEIGASPLNIIALIKKHMSGFSNLKVLDLGCGKGAVSVKIAEKFKCRCHGIDAIKEFIEEATQKAEEYNVASICKFEIADIRERIKELPGYDVIILGAIGPVFGNYYDTMITLLPHLNINGIVIIDDAYIDDSSTFDHPLILKRTVLINQLQEAGMTLVDETEVNEPEEYDKEYDYVQQRCRELMQKYPEKIQLFEDYIKKQREEYDILENKVICPTMVIKRQV